MKRLLLSPLFFIFIFTISAQEQYSRVKILADRDDMISLASKGLAVDNGIIKADEYIICELSSHEIRVVKEAGLQFEILIEDMSKFYEERNAPYLHDPDALKEATYTLSRDWPVPEGFELGPVGGFLTIDQCYEHLDSMAAQYPGLITPRNAMEKSSHNGRQMFWVRLSDNPAVNEDEPEVLYTGMHHAREPIGMAALIYYMYYLLENYNTDPDCRYIVDNFELYFVPIINVDGYAYNIQNNPNGGGMWRKNRRQNEDGSYGVDLNRNYGYMWGYNNSGSSPNPWEDTYRGPVAFSEPEIQNIRDLCETNEFRLALNYHSYANQLLYPWGYTPELCADDEIFYEFGKILTYENGYEFGPGSTTIYPTNGGSDDWMYGEQATKEKIFSYTLEVGDGSAGFWPPSSMIIPLCQANMLQNFMLAKLAGPWAIVKDMAPSILENKTGLLFFDIRRLGLEEGATYTVSVEPLNDAIDSVSPPLAFSGLEILESAGAAFTYFLKEAIQDGEPVDYLLVMNNGLADFSDTIHKVYGTPIVVFQDSASNFSKWTSPKWNVTGLQYHSPDKSMADSPNGQYSNYDNNILTMIDPVDLTGTSFAVLSFWAKWDLQVGYDFVQVYISDDNGTSWTAMEGKYTTLGTPAQAAGQPVYDGSQVTWVKEEISLEPYAGKEIRIRFRLKSNSSVVADGFFWDDMTIAIVDLATGIAPAGAKNNAPVQVQFHPNPATDLITVTVFDNKLLQSNSRVAVFDMTGRKMADAVLTDQLQLDVSSWSAGMYFYSIVSAESLVSSGKIVIN